MSDSPLAGLPDDLARVLRDPSIIVPQDAAVFELVARWMDAPSNTASALTADEWQRAWGVTCRRMLDAQADSATQGREEIALHLDRIQSALAITFKDKTPDQARIAGAEAVREARKALLGIGDDE